MDLVVNLAADWIEIDDPAAGGVRRHAGAIAAGTRTRSYFVDPRQRTEVIGVHFRPGGAFPFLGISPSEIVDTHVSMNDLWGSSGRNLREQLLEVSSPAAQLAWLEALLLLRLKRARAGHPGVRAAVNMLRGDGSSGRVSEIARVLGISHRRFVEVFEREVGLTPKLCARLQRFHRVKRLLAARGQPPCWATFALEIGYCDQSHMIREFVEFSEITPSVYLRRSSVETTFDRAVHAYSGKAPP